MMSLGQYARFLQVGAVVGIIGVGIRELIARILVQDTVLCYSLSVLLAYGIGMILSFSLNQRFTFEGNVKSPSLSEFLTFVVITCVGLVSTWLLALAIRYGLHIDQAIGKFAAAMAFAAAALISSLITYPLNALFVFRHRELTGPGKQSLKSSARAGRL